MFIIEWRFCQVLYGMPDPPFWAVELIESASSFEDYIITELDKHAACEKAGKNCTFPRLIGNSLYDRHLNRLMDGMPQHYACIISSVRGFNGIGL